MATTAEVIGDDLPCKGCQYNLRGLAVDRACPECGVAVVKSLPPPPYAACDPAWVKRLAVGAELMFWAGVLGVAIVIFMVPFLLVTDGHGDWVISGGWYLAAGLAWVGVVLLAAPEPNLRWPEKRLSARRLVRPCLVAVPLLGVLVTVGPPMYYLHDPLLSSCYFAFVSTVWLTAGVGLGALLEHMKAMYQRIPSRGLEPTGRRVLGWMMGIFVPMVVIGGLTALLNDSLPAFMRLPIWLRFASILAVLGLTFLPAWVLVLLNWLRKGLWLSVASR